MITSTFDQNVTAELSRDQRFRRLVLEYFPVVCRTARNFGLGCADAEDVAQRVMLLARRRQDDLIDGRERAFLYRVTVRMTLKLYRSRRRRPEETSGVLEDTVAPGPNAEEIMGRRQACVELDHVLGQMPDKLRLAFVLFEVEQLSQPEIAAVLGIPRGTVASRLRLARELFERLARRNKVLPNENPI